MFWKKQEIPTTEDALPGREQATPVPERHEVLGTPLLPPAAYGWRGLRVSTARICRRHTSSGTGGPAGSKRAW